jgi:chloramphenicol 3-O phosphotransferase
VQTGAIILINGSSSAGKTTIARALRRALDQPYLRIDDDNFRGMLPERYFIGPDHTWIAIDPPVGDIKRQAYYIRTTRVGDETRMDIQSGPVGEAFRRGQRAAIAAFAEAGNNVIYVDVLFDRSDIAEYVELWREFTVWMVGVHCPLAEIERRERARGDRLVGHARWHFDLVHAHAVYDVEVDSSLNDSEECARLIVARMGAGPPEAFDRLREGV